MSFIKDFMEFKKYKNNQIFNTSELYVADYGKITVSDGNVEGKPNFAVAEFKPDRCLIVVEATQKEVTAYCKNKYGSLYDCDFSGHQFENPKNTKYYKTLTMNGKLIPLVTTKSILSHNNLFDATNFGIYDVAREVKTLNSVKNNNVRFASSVTLEDIYDLEEILNNTPYLSL